MLQELFQQHVPTLEAAIQAVKDRTFYAHWPEPPSGKIYGEHANDDGIRVFKSALKSSFELPHQLGAKGSVGEEYSPYGFPLEIQYPAYSVETLLNNARKAQHDWQKISLQHRAAILIECLEKAAAHFFAIGYATMHTTGQGFIMGFQASGPHAFDRALESIATGYQAITTFHYDSTWVKPMGKFEVSLYKKFHVRPKGINLTIGCSTFPIWNSLPGMFASLITGNVTIAKAHPNAILPMALCVQSFQHTLAKLGIDPHTIQLAVDTKAAPMTIELAKHEDVHLIDYTGSSSFGNHLEQIVHGSGKVLFTEKAGVNCVMISEAENLDAVLDNLAFSISLYSGQMCTAPQNFFIPKTGVRSGDSVIPFEEVVNRFAERVKGLVTNEKMGPGTLGALHNESVLERVKAAASSGLRIVLESHEILHEGFEKAVACSPIILLANADQKDVYEKEWFGPISFIIPVENFEDGINRMASSVKKHGALSGAVYTKHEDELSYAEDQLVAAGCPVAFNLIGPIWVNQSAAFSDFHGTGANPAGNASFADLSFITNRYNVIGTRKA